MSSEFFKSNSLQGVNAECGVVTSSIVELRPVPGAEGLRAAGHQKVMAVISQFDSSGAGDGHGDGKDAFPDFVG